MSKIEITSPHPERFDGAQVIIDGRDMSHSLRRYSVTHEGGDLRPTVTLELYRVEHQRLCMTAATVVLDDATQEFLIDLGWTPPEEDSGRGPLQVDPTIPAGTEVQA